MTEATAELQILERAPFPAIAVDAALRVVLWNERAAELFGVAAADAVGTDVTGVVAVVGDASWRELLAGDGGAAQVRQVLLRDGRTLTCEWTHQPCGAGTLLYPRDITARAASDELRKREGQLLRAIVDNLEIVVWAIDRRGIFTFHEGKGLSTFGQPQGAFVGQSLFELYAGASGVGAVEAALYRGEFAYSQTDVHGLQWENFHIPVRDERGEVEGVVGVTLNISELKRSENELRAKLTLVERQQQVIRELGTPIIEVWDRILTLPMIGLVDSVRTAEIMDNLLQAVTRTRARFAVLDLTGVETLDTATASHLLGLIRAIRLLGAEGIITGIQPNVAQTMVTLGLDLSTFVVHADLRSALKYCVPRIGAKPTPGR